jgi:SET domain-containing protein
VAAGPRPPPARPVRSRPHVLLPHRRRAPSSTPNVGGNAARWINHACNPNCEADEVDGRIFIKARRAIKAGEELFYDYGLVIDERYTPALKKRFECRCGTRGCRGTMLSPKR